MKVLIVDDSVVFRSSIKAAINGVGGIEVAGTAPDGKIALEKVQQTQVDLIVLDLEMPKLNGIDTIKELKKIGHNARIIVFAAESMTGASLAFEALRAGADDFLAKAQSSSPEEAQKNIANQLVPKILQFVQESEPIRSQPASDSVSPSEPINNLSEGSNKWPEVILIGSSTGGPNALEEIFRGIQGPITRPILIVQHMPAVFTELLAKRIEAISGVPCVEGKRWMPVDPSTIYIAPGGYHMTVRRDEKGDPYINLDQGPQRNSVRPAVDSLFETAADSFGKNIAAFILTGMGEDGLVGAKKIKAMGGRVIIQDKDSSVVFGMPGAIFKAGLFDEMGNLEKIREILHRMAKAPPLQNPALLGRKAV